MFVHSFIAMEYAFALSFLLLIDQLMQRDHLGGGRFIQKALNQRLFPEITESTSVVQWLDVVASSRRCWVQIPHHSFFLLSFFSRFFVFLFSINIYLNNCYLIKCNKQQEKYRVSSEKIVHPMLNIWINNLNFYHFLQFTVGKPELITTCNVPESSFC